MFGADVGTTRCKMAGVDTAGRPFMITNALGDTSTPSVVYRAPDGAVLVGAAAREQGFVDPANCARNFKLALGTNVSLVEAGQTFTPTDATEAMIAAMVTDAEDRTGLKVEELIATCPANFRDDAKQGLLEAFERRGIKVLRLIPEPTAAAYAYAADKGSGKMTVAVYDFGGGTFDASILEINGAQMNVLATSGIAKLGGNDINNCLQHIVLAEMETQSGQRPTEETDPLFFMDLDQRVEQAKISLNSREEVPIVTSFNGQQIIVTITQTRFHEAIRPLVQQSLDAFDRALQDAGLTTTQIDRLLMVGGSSRMPFIQEQIASHTGLVPRTDIDADAAIACGAALACVGEMASDGRSKTIHGHTIPAMDMYFRDVTAHDVGCAVVDKSGASKRMVNSVIVGRNTTIPCQRTDQFYLDDESQTECRVEILQGIENAGRDDCLLIGHLLLSDLPREDKRSARITVEYVIDANGMVIATATDKVSGTSATVSVDYKKGLKPQPEPTAA